MLAPRFGRWSGHAHGSGLCCLHASGIFATAFLGYKAHRTCRVVAQLIAANSNACASGVVSWDSTPRRPRCIMKQTELASHVRAVHGCTPNRYQKLRRNAACFPDNARASSSPATRHDTALQLKPPALLFQSTIGLTQRRVSAA